MRSDPAVKWGQARRSEGAISVAADPSPPAGSAGTQPISVPGVALALRQVGAHRTRTDTIRPPGPHAGR